MSPIPAVIPDRYFSLADEAKFRRLKSPRTIEGWVRRGLINVYQSAEGGFVVDRLEVDHAIALGKIKLSATRLAALAKPLPQPPITRAAAEEAEL